MTRTRFVKLSVFVAATVVTGALGAAPVAAQASGVAGMVVDATNGAPINGAQVTVAGTQRGGLTNAAGRFLVLNVPAGPQTVRVTYIGYRTVEQTVDVSAGAPRRRTSASK